MFVVLADFIDYYVVTTLVGCRYSRLYGLVGYYDAVHVGLFTFIGRLFVAIPHWLDTVDYDGLHTFCVYVAVGCGYDLRVRLTLRAPLPRVYPTLATPRYGSPFTLPRYGCWFRCYVVADS